MLLLMTFLNNPGRGCRVRPNGEETSNSREARRSRQRVRERVAATRVKILPRQARPAKRCFGLSTGVLILARMNNVLSAPSAIRSEEGPLQTITLGDGHSLPTDSPFCHSRSFKRESRWVSPRGPREREAIDRECLPPTVVIGGRRRRRAGRRIVVNVITTITTKARKEAQ